MPEDTVVAVLAALGVDASTPRAVRAALDRHALGGDRLLPPTVVSLRRARPLRPPRPRTATPPTARIAAPSPRPPGAAGVRAGPSALRPRPGLPEGTLLHVDTESGESLPWDGSAFFRGNRALRASGSAALASASAATGIPSSAGRLPLGVHTLRALPPTAAPPRPPDRRPRPGARAARAQLRLPGPALLPAVRAAPGAWATSVTSPISPPGRGARSAPASSRSTRCTRPYPGDAHRPLPLPPLLPPLPRPRPSADRGHPRVRLPRPAPRARVPTSCSRGPRRCATRVLRQGRADRPGRGVGAQARGAGAGARRCRSGPGRRAAYCDFLAEQGAGAGGPRHLVRARRGARPRLARAGPPGLRDPRSARNRPGPRRADGPGRLPLPARLAHRRPARRRAAGRARGGHGRRARARPGRRRAPGRRRRLGAAGRLRRRACRSGAPPDAFNARGQDWGLPPWRPDALAAAGLRPLPRAAARPAAARGRAAHRPCDGPVPAVVGPGGPAADRGHVRPLRRARRCSRVLALEAHRAGRRGHRRGPGHGRAGRARGAARARRAGHVGAVVRAGLRRAGGGSGGAGGGGRRGGAAESARRRERGARRRRSGQGARARAAAADGGCEGIEGPVAADRGKAERERRAQPLAPAAGGPTAWPPPPRTTCRPPRPG